MISWEKLEAGFKRHFGVKPQVMARAPGRINLIGEHIDYVGGHVLPMSINLGVGAAIGIAKDGKTILFSRQLSSKNIPADEDNLRSARELVEEILEELKFPPIHIYVDSDLPIGAGLSSSAAFSVAVVEAAIALKGEKELSPVALTELCVNAEYRALGTKCGLMDPFVSILGEENMAIVLNCHDNTYVKIPANFGTAELFVIDSGKPRALAQSGYNKRRAETEEAIMKIMTNFPKGKSLWEVKNETLELLPTLDNISARRLRHVITEDNRVLHFAEALENGDVSRMGKLLSESHNSLKIDYEVSTPEIDFIVDWLNAKEAVFGSRIVGGGFGGSALALVEQGSIEGYLPILSNEYFEKYGLKIRSFRVRSCGGAEVWLEKNAHKLCN